VIQADLVIRHAGLLCTMVARDSDALGRIRDGAVAARDGRVVWVGRDADLEAAVKLDGDLINVAGRCVLPGLVDPHTHPVFAGSRAADFYERLTPNLSVPPAGRDPIVPSPPRRGRGGGIPNLSRPPAGRGRGGGIPLTVRLTREADPETLLANARQHGIRFLGHGTTTIEAKTGYGLDLEQEDKLLTVLAKLPNVSPLRVIPTFLGAHAVPEGVKRDQYVSAIVDQMLPAFKGRARFCDAWCDPPAFTPAETRRILGRAKELGYGLRLHTAQTAPGEGPMIAAELGAASADHLEYATPDQARALARAGVVAVLCPGANFTVPGSPSPPIAEFRKAGLTMAIASDLNPGTSSSESLTFAMTLACVRWGMTVEEVMLGATRHAAHSLGLDGVAGCLAPGSYADAAVFDVEAPEEIPYHVGVNRAVVTIVGGRAWTAP
jgi:imidazolonepropionase